MKLRQKLATALVAATVVSAVPVVTMAASDNRVTKNITVVAGTKFESTTTSPAIVLEAKDTVKGEEFLLELENCKWTDWDATAADEIVLAGTENAKVVIVGDKTAKVTVDINENARGASIKIPLLVEVTQGVAKVSVEAGTSTITSETYEFATTQDVAEEATITVGTLKSVYEAGAISDIVINESVAGSLANGGTFTMTLNHGDYDFVVPRGGEIELVGGKGFAGQKAIKAQVAYGRYDNELVVTLPKLTSTIKGSLTLKGIEVESNVKAPREGKLTVDFTGKYTGTQRGVEVATVTTYGTSVDSKAKDVYAGKEAAIAFSIKENVADSLREGRALEITLDKGYFIEVEKDANGRYDAAATLTKLKGAFTTIKAGVAKISLTDLNDVEAITKDDKVIGFEFTVNNFKGLSFEADIQLPLAVEGEVKVELNGRALEKNETVATTVLNVAAPFEIKGETTKVLAGKAKQNVGEITVTEKAAGNFAYGEKIQITLPSEFKFGKVPTVEVTAGDLELGKVEYTTNADKEPVLEITVKRESRTASTIKIKDFDVTVNGYTPNGEYGIEIGGLALTETAEGVEIENFFNVVDTLEETVVTEAAFVIGSSAFVVNGEEKTMDVAPYISEQGNTMIPLRYVAAALGISEQNIIWNGGTAQTVTIFDGEKVLQLQIGKNVAKYNGVDIPMNSPAVIKDGRTCVPVGEIGRLLGADVTWDADTKTASFKR